MRRRLRRFPTVARWADPDDVLNGAMVRLLHALREVEPTSQEALFGLAVEEIRRECLDLARHYRGSAWQALHAPCPARGLGWATDPSEGPGKWEDLSELQDALGKLSAADHAFLRLLFWGGRSQDEVARLLQVSARTVQRRWTALLRKVRSDLNGE